MNSKNYTDDWYDGGFFSHYCLSDDDYSKIEDFLEKRLSENQKWDLQHLSLDYYSNYQRHNKNIGPPGEQIKKVENIISKTKKLIDAMDSFDMLTVKTIARANNVDEVDMIEFFSVQKNNLESIAGYAKNTLQKSKNVFQDPKSQFTDNRDVILKKKKGAINSLIWKLADFYEKQTGDKAKLPCQNYNKDLEYNSSENWIGRFYEFVSLFIKTIKIEEKDYQSRVHPSKDDKTSSVLPKIVIDVLNERKRPSS